MIPSPRDRLRRVLNDNPFAVFCICTIGAWFLLSWALSEIT